MHTLVKSKYSIVLSLRDQANHILKKTAWTHKNKHKLAYQFCTVIICIHPVTQKLSPYISFGIQKIVSLLASQPQQPMDLTWKLLLVATDAFPLTLPDFDRPR